MANEELIETTATVDPITPTPSVRGSSILEQLGVNAQDILQAPNIESTLTAPQAPVSDALGIFTAQEEAQGIPGLRTAFKDAQARRLRGEQLGREEQLTIEGRRKKLGVLRGEQAQAAKQATADIQTLFQGEQLAQEALGSAQSIALQRGNILYQEYQTKNNLLLEFPGLDINPLTDTFEDISAKLEEHQEEAKKKAFKENLKEELRALGKSTGGLNTKKLEAKLRKHNKSAIDEAKDRADQEWNMKVAKFNKSMRESDKDIDLSKETNQRALANELLDEAEGQGLFGNNAYEYAIDQGKLLNLDVAEGSNFDNQIRARFNLEPNRI